MFQVFFVLVGYDLDMSTQHRATYYLTHAPEALRRFEWGFAGNVDHAVNRAEDALGAVAIIRARRARHGSDAGRGV